MKLCTRKRLQHLGIAAALTLGAGTLAPSASQAAACHGADLQPTTANVTQVRSAVLCLTNADRARHGLRALKDNPKLRSAATAHSSDMVATRYFDHTTPSGASFVDRIRRAGYIHPGQSWKLGENIASGTGALGTARGAEHAWMHSAGHRANILTRGYREMGIGVQPGTPTGDANGATFTTDFGAKG